MSHIRCSLDYSEDLIFLRKLVSRIKNRPIQLSDILSADSSALDMFIEQKLNEAGHSLNKKNNVNIMLNPKKDEIIHEEQGAILLK